MRNLLHEDDTFSYAYDGEGNLTQRTRLAGGSFDDKTVEYAWDRHNRLISVTQRNSGNTITLKADYLYDAAGRRVAKIVDPDGSLGSATLEIETYAHDGHDLLHTRDGNGDVTHRYLNGVWCKNSSDRFALESRSVLPGEGFDFVRCGVVFRSESPLILFQTNKV